MTGPATTSAPAEIDSIPQALFRDVPFQSSAAWWRCVIATAIPDGYRSKLMLASQGDRSIGLLPLLTGRNGSRATGLVTPYTTLYQPILLADTDPVDLGRTWARACREWPVMQFDALDASWPQWTGLLRGFASAGWRASWFDSFGAWHSTDADCVASGWHAYLAARPGALRETIRRKLARAERDAETTVSLVTTLDDLPAALLAYEDVYRRSWKTPEPYPGFGPALLAAAASTGVLRLGVLRHRGEPVAAQYWIVGGRHAGVLKLAHDEAARALSPGTVLTAWMIRSLLAEGITSLDFGRGDDAYKQLWVSGRRQAKGLILAQPWRPAGAIALARQAVGTLRKRFWMLRPDRSISARQSG